MLRGRQAARLIAEAVRLVKPGGIIAFTDWVEGPSLTDHEAERFLRFMKFPNVRTLDGYAALLSASRLRGDGGRGHGPIRPATRPRTWNMLDMQLTYDALRIIGFDAAVLEAMAAEMQFHAAIWPTRARSPRAC